MSDLEEYRLLLSERKLYRKNLRLAERRLRFADRRYRVCLQARDKVIAAIDACQIDFKKEIDSLVTLVLRGIFDRKFEFDLQFIKKADRMECIPILREGGNVYDPRDELGGSTKSLVGFGMRIVMWTLKSPRTRPLFVLDEPFTKLGKRLISQAAEMLKQISEKLNVQIILITHEPELARAADRVFRVTHDGNVAHVDWVDQKGDSGIGTSKVINIKKTRHYARIRKKSARGSGKFT